MESAIRCAASELPGFALFVSLISHRLLKSTYTTIILPFRGEGKHTPSGRPVNRKLLALSGPRNHHAGNPNGGEFFVMTDTPLSNEPVLLRSDADYVATLTLNRGAKFNALSRELMSAIQAEIADIVESADVRVVIIAGTGKAFCAGHDLGEMRADPSSPAMEALFTQCSDMMTSLTKIPQPVIAKVHGMATAAGCQLVAQCDLAVTVEDATFATSGVNVGLFCSTPMVAVTRNLSRKQAMEMLLTGEFIDAETALRYGLVNRVVPAVELDDAVNDLAAMIVNKSPIAIARGKQLFYEQIDENLDAAYTRATKVITANMQDEDTRAGIDAFAEKRPMPDWKGK